MDDEKLTRKLANIPLARPGFDTLSMSAPVLVQMNPEGKWENKRPDNLEEERLKAVVRHLVDSKTVAMAQSYCSQCVEENQKDGCKSNYVPVILMPICPADECPFDMDCEVQKMKDKENKPDDVPRKSLQIKEDEKEKDTKKSKKRGYVLQRLTDFDLLSQW